MARNDTQEQTDQTELVLPQALVEQFKGMVTLIPDADEGGVANIVSQILNATTADELDKPWSDNDRGIPLGKPFTLLAVSKRASDFRDGLGFYLELDVIDLQSGEPRVYVTGSVSAVAQITAAYAGGMLPLTFKLVEAEKASKAGYKPQHLEVIADTAKPARAGKRG